MARSASQTLSWNSVPDGASGRSNRVRAPGAEKYSSSWTRVRASTSPAPPRPSSGTHSPRSPGGGPWRLEGNQMPVSPRSVAARVSRPTGVSSSVKVVRISRKLLPAPLPRRGARRAGEQEVPLPRVPGEGRGAREFGPGLLEAPQLEEQVPAHAGQEMVVLERRFGDQGIRDFEARRGPERHPVRHGAVELDHR